GQCLLHSALRARFQVKGVTLHFLYDVFRLNLAFEPTQGILDRLAFLQSNFCQSAHPQAKTNRSSELNSIYANHFLTKNLSVAPHPFRLASSSWKTIRQGTLTPSSRHHRCDHRH